jgi:hypothetical protein
MSALLGHDPVVQEYHAFFSLFDWSLVDQWQAQRSSRGRPAHPISAYLKALLIRIHRKFIYASELRHFLVTHPLLIIELGFRLVLDPSAPYGFDVEKTLPCRYWFCQKLRTLDQTLLQQLLHATVTALQAEIPGLGETVAFDVKHIYAWVKENNERVFVTERYDKEKRLAGDPDCRLGVKKSSNQEKTEATSGAEAPAPSPQKKKKKSASPDPAKQPLEPEKEKKELIWGYGSGVAAATHPTYGDVVLAEYTQPFNENDITYFRPLYQQAVVALNRFPTNITADAAFDAWYVHEAAASHGGIGAIPLRQPSKNPVVREADGTPHCPKGLLMHPTKQFNHTYGYRAQRFQCPLLFPEKTGDCCDHEQFTKGKGCVKDVNWELGGRMRVTLDRESSLYKEIYNQRTSAERINSQAKEFGIERPKVRNIHSVRNLNTLIYLVINVRALVKAKSINSGVQQMI